MKLETLIAWIDKQLWLDTLATPIQNGIRNLYTSKKEIGLEVRDFLHGRWLGHPLHAVLTDIPIGSWTVAIFLDVLSLFTARRIFNKSADAAIALGLGGATGAALAGATDWHHLQGHPRRIGMAHWILNMVVTAFFGLSLLARQRHQRSTGRWLAGIGYALLSISAYLGGHLAYGDKIGATHQPTPVHPKQYTPVLPLNELKEGELRRVLVDNYPVLIVRHQGMVYALAETCSHMGGPLSEGHLEQDNIVCPWHGSKYCLENGSIDQGPSIHPQATFEVRIHDGEIEIRVSREEVQHGYGA